MGSRNDIREGCFRKRDQKWSPEMTSADDFRGTLRSQRIRNLKSKSVSCSCGFFGSLSAWWVCGTLLVVFGERNCSVGKIVGRNPDDSGQVTVNQRTTTPLFKVIIRDR